MKRIIILISVLLIYVLSFGQDIKTVNLEDCYKNVVENHPIYKQLNLYSSTYQLEQKNLQTNYLPSLSLNGQATYQSDVTKIPFQLPNMNIEEMSKDQYKLTFDVTQSIYDGGLTQKQKNINEIDFEINKQAVEIELYKLKERVNQIYFNIIYLKENKKILNISKKNIESKLKIAKTAVVHGTLLQSDVDELTVGMIGLEQKITEVEIGIQASIKILIELTSLEIDENTNFDFPDIEIGGLEFQNLRPEYQLLNLQQTKISTLKEVVSSKKLPRLAGFGKAGYGRPGFDMLSNEFDFFYFVGAQISWSPFNWNKSKREKEILNIRNNIIKTQKEAFDKNLKIDLESKLFEMKKYEELIIKDIEIIELRKKILKTASSKFDNGVITSSDYIEEVNAETQAQLNLQTHKIQLIIAKINYLTSIGKL
ncbi:MAG: TolC family protein [Bacteroidales bacterium]|nr:TolC family protein [Bacteroidales bacterium]